LWSSHSDEQPGSILHADTSTPYYCLQPGFTLLSSSGFRGVLCGYFQRDRVPETEPTRPALQEILHKPIRELGLKIEGSPLERLVHQLYRDFERKKLMKFRPACYLTDEWGCPSGEPVIGIPFYLANPDLAHLEKEANDLEDSRETMMFLRHEAGHAFNYAYRLHRTPEWKQLFGSFRRPYHDIYRPVPFSRDYVRYLPGWYAQKHPDEDFAETFAVWLTPRSAWRKRYRGWGAMAKLRYMDRIARELGNVDPVRRRGQTDITVDEMEMTVAEFYRRDGEEVALGDLSLDTDLRDIFDASKRRKNARPAQEFMHVHRKTIVDKVAYWTGAQRPLIKKLIESIEKRLGELNLFADADREAEHLIQLTVYATALATNYVSRGKFVQP
jgi:putative zinc-binding metallo-peptidase